MAEVVTKPPVVDVLLASEPMVTVVLPVTAVFATGPPGNPMDPPVIDELFSYRLGIAVALFLLLVAEVLLILAKISLHLEAAGGA